MSRSSRSIEVAAEPEAILRVVRDVTTYPDWQREIRSVEVASRDERGRPLRITVGVHAVGRGGWYTVDYAYPAEHVVAYHLVESDLMTRNDARFTVVAAGAGRSRLTVEMDLALRWPLPRAIVDRLVHRGVTDMLARVKDRAENGT